LAFYRQAWSGGGGSNVDAIFRVLVPTIDADTGAVLRLYYGNAAAGDASNAPAVFADSEVMLPLNDASGPFADLTGNGHTGADTATSQAGGIIEHGREWDAVGDKITITDHADLEGMDELTVELWAKSDSVGNSTSYGRFFGTNDITDYGAARTAPAPNYTLLWRTAGSADVNSANGAAPFGAWLHLLFVYKRNSNPGKWIYVNGASAGSGAAANLALPSTANDLVIGNVAAGTTTVDGIQENFRLWRSAAPCGNLAAYAKFTYANVTAADNELTWGDAVILPRLAGPIRAARKPRRLPVVPILFHPSTFNPHPFRPRSGLISPATFRTRYRLDGRGKYRVFAAAEYRFYGGPAPPVEGDAPLATAATLFWQYLDGDWLDGTYYIAVSYFNGLLDSGFLPIGPAGEPYTTLTIDAEGLLAESPPAQPLDWRVEQRAGGIVAIVGVYAETGLLAATEWCITYTTDGSTPAVDTPTATVAMIVGDAIQGLEYDLPAGVDLQVVKIRIQTRRPGAVPATWVYSQGSTVLSHTIDLRGPTMPLVGYSTPQ
ncbi:MAG: hypothetical protein IMZ55_11840, partial [Acidobacteria bacterium]|nr:hypothetical protein [Acidobacteriota bacterium]